MELCNRTFGFFDVATLIVLVNPFSADPAVRRLVLELDADTVIPDDIQGEARVDLMHRLTTYFHERKHFHDMLLTPEGNRIVRLHILYAALCMSIYTRRQWRKGTVELPLRAPDVAAEDLELIMKMRGRVHAALQRSRSACELSALLAQIQTVWQFFGEDATAALLADFRDATGYGPLAAHLSGWDVPESARADVNRAFHQVVLAVGLGSTAIEEDSAAQLSEVMSRLREVVARGSRGVAQVVAAGDAAWRTMFDNLEEAAAENELFIADIQRRLDGWPEAIQQMYAVITHEFAAEAAALQESVAAEPDAYLRSDRYVSELRFAAPRLYYYSDDPATSLFTEPLNVDEHLLASYEVFDEPRGKRYAYRLFPAKEPEGSWAFSEMWEHFAQVAGTTALFEETDWNHPLRTWFLRRMADEGVRFVRRM